jgi:hypothetical protein
MQSRIIKFQFSINVKLLTGNNHKNVRKINVKAAFKEVALQRGEADSTTSGSLWLSW